MSSLSSGPTLQVPASHRIVNATERHCHVANVDTGGYFDCMWLKSHTFSEGNYAAEKIL
jgi:hypothetical protein